MGVVQAGNRRSVPAGSTMHTRPADRAQALQIGAWGFFSVGARRLQNRLSFLFVTTYSPSMRTEIVLLFNATLLFFSPWVSGCAGSDSQIAAQAAAAFFQRLVWD